MNILPSIFRGTIRHGMTAGGGALTVAGNDLQQWLGIASLVLGIIWSIVDKLRRKPKIPPPGIRPTLSTAMLLALMLKPMSAAAMPPPLPPSTPIPRPANLPAQPQVTITWPAVQEPKLTTYRVYHLTQPPPTDKTAIPTNALTFDIGPNNRFLLTNLDRSKTNYWAVTWLADVRRIIGGSTCGIIRESDISNWVELPPATQTIAPPRNMRNPQLSKS